jgi:hypothetical protein
MTPRPRYFWLSLILLGCVQASENTGSLSSFVTMNLPRAGHTATLLADGKVLIAGGCIAQGCETKLTASAELYDPAQQTFRDTGPLQVARVGHRALRLASGDVLILGGWAGAETTAIIERYSVQRGRFETAGELLEPRDGFTATVLHNGKILVTGGYNGTMNRLASAELYEPVTQTSHRVAAMSTARMAHTASLLPDGRVLLVGGSRGRGEVLSSAELFDPATNTFRVVGDLSIPRHKHAAVSLPSGDLLIIGGSGAGDFAEQYSSTERFDPTTLTFQPNATMHGERFKISDAVATLSDGDILVVGSNPEAELYDNQTEIFSVVEGSLEQALFYSTATELENEQVLVTGGYDNNLRVTDHTWLYQRP